jgi:VIT1/CCC1 family predicted Fe2+/Mn2+ transporter
MIQLVITLALVGFVLWALLTYVPMPEIIRNLIIVVVVICVLYYLFTLFGFADIPLPHRGRTG